MDVVHFILQIGYFKCKFMFFTFTFEQVAADVSHILRRYFPKAKLSQNNINKKTRQMHQGRILQLFGYQAFDEPVKRKLLEKALDAIRIQAGPVSVLEQLLDFLNENRICMPGYSTLQDIVSQAFLAESKRVHSIIRHHTTPDVEHSLTRLFEGEEDLEKISALKKQAKGFNHQEVLKEVDKKQRYARLYAFAKKVIPKLQISTQNIGYYASLVDYYTVDKLRALPSESSHLYALCYIFHCFQKINDNLVNSFIFWVNDCHKCAKEAARQKVYEFKTEANACLEKTGDVLGFFVDPSIPDETHFGEVRSKVFEVMTQEQIVLVAQYIDGAGFDETAFRWEHYALLARKKSRTLRPLIQTIDFDGSEEAEPLLEALEFIRQNFKKGQSIGQLGDSEIPKDVVPNKMESYLLSTATKEPKDPADVSLAAKIDPYKYEFLIYDLLEKYLASGKIFVSNSLSYKSLREDLISDEKWKDKEKILQQLGNPKLLRPIGSQLDELKVELNALLVHTNTRIKNGENQDIQLKDNGRWKLPFDILSGLKAVRFLGLSCNQLSISAG